MNHSAVLSLDDERALSIYRALAPELDRAGTRTEVHLRVPPDGSRLTLTVRSRDITALRAGLNTWLRLINIAKEMQEIDSYG